MRLTPGVDLIKLFWHKFIRAFLYARPFYNIRNICCIAMKRYILQKE
jgi:hypothetical protein